MPKVIYVGMLIGTLAGPLAGGGAAVAQSWPLGYPPSNQLSRLEDRVENLEENDLGADWGCGISLLFGAFCALWAQNTGRGPYLWFFLGFFFTCITVLVLLQKNANDIAKRNPPGRWAPMPENPGPGGQDEGGGTMAMETATSPDAEDSGDDTDSFEAGPHVRLPL